MKKQHFMLYVALGLGLLFLIPVAESTGMFLGKIATILVIGYWASIGLFFLVFLLKSIFSDYGVTALLFNLWLFLSLMCVAVGTLAIIDDGIHKASWAAWLIVYGVTVGYINRKEL